MANTAKKLITHNGSFHTDDVFAAATLSIMLENKGESFEIIRTRDMDIIKTGDYVFDVGDVYDPESDRFDHHQEGGAGKRNIDGGIEYAAFGLVWRKFGVGLCKSQEVADSIDRKLVTPIDAGDNGINLVELKSEVVPYFIQSAFNSFVPTWKNTSKETLHAGFLECAKIAKNILKNEIARAKDTVGAREIIVKIYQEAEDKRIIILDKKYDWFEQVLNYPEPIFVIYPRTDGTWGAEGVRVDKMYFKNRKDFPASWGGARDEELQKITGIDDAVFCHRALFLAVAKSREGAIGLARKALED